MLLLNLNLLLIFEEEGYLCFSGGLVLRNLPYFGLKKHNMNWIILIITDKHLNIISGLYVFA